jgi:hypothetical protein
MNEPKRVEILTAFRERGPENKISVNVVLTYLKGRPIATANLTPADALKLAGDLVKLAELDIRKGRA